jgi:hypothetical protein
MKHVGKMKNNGAKIVVVYRTLPGDSGSALVVGAGSLPESWHDSMMNLIQDTSGQSANELADILAVRKFPDGHTMLDALHNNGLLKKVPTSGVIMTPAPNASVLLSELNQIIAEQRGVTIDQLAISEGVKPNPKTSKKTEEIISSPAEDLGEIENLSPTQLRSKADKLFKEAQALRKQADALDPPKSKKKEVISEEVE